jgi:hypothetical protein
MRFTLELAIAEGAAEGLALVAVAGALCAAVYWAWGFARRKRIMRATISPERLKELGITL